jgi:hypothetical protein
MSPRIDQSVPIVAEIEQMRVGVWHSPRMADDSHTTLCGILCLWSGRP